MSTVLTLNCPTPAIPINEVVRYMGSPKNDEVLALAEQATELIQGVLRPAACFIELKTTLLKDEIKLGPIVTRSAGLKKNLKDCERVCLFAATIGSGVDRLINQKLISSPALALALDSAGSAAIEEVCDDVCRKLSSLSGRVLRPRFSPGYGDLPLSLQGELISLLDCHRKIGLSLTESLMLTPTKSVTAFVGITNEEV